MAFKLHRTVLELLDYLESHRDCFAPGSCDNEDHINRILDDLQGHREEIYMEMKTNSPTLQTVGSREEAATVKDGHVEIGGVRFDFGS